ncbi:MAG: aminotransferase class I/II-fold pyridoxal phosphate-dependent enzyme [Acidimicrobiales bacterium]|nr:aminotransferase class I/II-fold pyridoxal phosphate-dependent enzyme [Acidimicrobiales bacterium]RZV48853.1 MAG: aminotransferase class I/II-fold pyridoxal phosphate-dependent enzyme [Acidimicrobiales bacterium]
MTSRPIDPFYVMEVVANAQRREREGHAVFHLEVGQPATGAPAGAIAAGHELLDHDVLGYTISSGIPELAPAIAAHAARTYGIDLDPGRIALTQGATGAIVLAILAAFEPGARVGVTNPGYPCYRNMLVALHMEPVLLDVDETTRFQPTTSHLEAAGPLDGVIVASPSNPTGTVLSPGELQTIAAWCDSHDVRLISDEIYHGLIYGDAEATTAASYSDSAIVINSFSKYFSMTGWRIGWAVLPEPLAEPFDRLAQNLVICPPALSQHMALAALNCRDELDGHVSRYTTNRQILLDGLPRAGMPDLAPADGAFYIWARTDHLAADSKTLAAEWLRDFGVAATPGVDFDPKRGHKYMRFSFCGSPETMHGAIDALTTWRMRSLAS